MGICYTLPIVHDGYKEVGNGSDSFHKMLLQIRQIMWSWPGPYYGDQNTRLGQSEPGIHLNRKGSFHSRDHHEAMQGALWKKYQEHDDINLQMNEHPATVDYPGPVLPGELVAAQLKRRSNPLLADCIAVGHPYNYYSP